MSLDRQAVIKIARLARIKLDESEIAPMQQELNGILSFIDQLNAVDTTGIAPMASVSTLAPTLRPDVVNDGGIAARIVANAPESAENYFIVPKVVE